MKSYLLSLGSNIDPQKNIPLCLEALKKQFELARISSPYETDPVGPAGSLKFWNLCLEIKTELEAPELVESLRRIETSLGRKRTTRDKFAPRTIDIDLLPQPGYREMAFIMIPLAEMASAAKDPETDLSFGELARRLENLASVRRLPRSLLELQKAR